MFSGPPSGVPAVPAFTRPTLLLTQLVTAQALPAVSRTSDDSTPQATSKARFWRAFLVAEMRAISCCWAGAGPVLRRAPVCLARFPAAGRAAPGVSVIEASGAPPTSTGGGGSVMPGDG